MNAGRRLTLTTPIAVARIAAGAAPAHRGARRSSVAIAHPDWPDNHARTSGPIGRLADGLCRGVADATVESQRQAARPSPARREDRP